MGFWNYSNPAWEPAFELISPKLARLYFSTNFGPVKWFAATAMFKALGEMEEETFLESARFKGDYEKALEMYEAYIFVKKLKTQFILDEELFMEISSAYDESVFSFVDTFPKAIVKMARENGWKV